MDRTLESRADSARLSVSPPAAQAAVSWPAIIAGAFVAAAVSLMLFALGSGLGFAAISPWPGRGVSVTTFALTSAIWFIVMQWVSSGVGGYIAGRLRTRWMGTHTHEVFFRDTAHGLVTWAVATVLVAAVLTSSMFSDLAGAAAVPAAMDQADADVARKAAAQVAIYTALSMLVGAFIASVSAALGGRLRDEHA